MNVEKFTQLLFHDIGKKRGSGLSGREKIKVVEVYKLIDFRVLKGMNMKAAYDIIVDAMVEELKVGVGSEDRGGGDEGDNNQNGGDKHISEVLRGEIGTVADDIVITQTAEKLLHRVKEEGKSETVDGIDIDGLLGVGDLGTLKMLVNPSSMLVEHYVLLDTDYRDTSIDTTNGVVTQFRWKYANDVGLATGYFNTVRRMNNIIGVKILQPRVYMVGTGLPTSRALVAIEELSAQSYISRLGIKYHFALRADYITLSGGMIDLVGGTDEEYQYKFRSPITVINSLTVSYYDAESASRSSFTAPVTRYSLCFVFTCLNT